MEQKINLRIAANDKLKVIEEKLLLSKIFLGIIAILIITSFFGITLQIGIILSLIIIWMYKSDLKEKKRMRNIYAL